ncbi:MAG: DUF4197 domain-containing protein [Marinilabiliaceae bacterium]|jgi:hypothetical protein|nr:DUF4197 domain-containing protein [Marinilabiliaceae bacterium]
MKKITITLIVAIALILSACAELLKTLETVTAVAPLTEGEVSQGLKEALITGAKNSAAKLGATDGYFGDELIKILLPEEANVIIENISKIPGGDKLVQDAILSINRAAEDAAREVAPIFIASVRQMTIGDAFSILRGEDDAATQYLHRTTYNELFNLYSPKIESSVRKPLVAGVSTQDSWEALTGQWNKLANSVAGRIAGLKSVDTDLGDYLTAKALEGMFVKVAEEELKIRKDVNARVSPILQKVFGSLDK